MVKNKLMKYDVLEHQKSVAYHQEKSSVLLDPGDRVEIRGLKKHFARCAVLNGENIGEELLIRKEDCVLNFINLFNSAFEKEVM